MPSTRTAHHGNFRLRRLTKAPQKAGGRPEGSPAQNPQGRALLLFRRKRRRSPGPIFFRSPPRTGKTAVPPPFGAQNPAIARKGPPRKGKRQPRTPEKVVNSSHEGFSLPSQDPGPGFCLPQGRTDRKIHKGRPLSSDCQSSSPGRSPGERSPSRNVKLPEVRNSALDPVGPEDQPGLDGGEKEGCSPGGKFTDTLSSLSEAASARPLWCRRRKRQP